MRKKIRTVMGITMLILLAIALILLFCIRLKGVDASIIKGVRFSILFLTFSMVVLFIVIDQLIKRQLTDGMHQLIHDMERIAEGNLNVVSYVKGNPEFEQMSHGINAMVRNISRTSGMLSRVFEMMDAQFAVFEFNEEAKNVTITDRLGLILGIPTNELGPMIQDKNLFRTRIAWIIKSPIPNEQDVFQVGTPERPRYVRINLVVEKNSTFGMVADVTEEIQTKQNIIKERDYDPLTKIRNRRSFERDVTKLLQSNRNLSECAMIMIDLDKFKSINDNYGHAFGDEYLQKAAGFISRFSKRNCIVARRSGDEFYLIIHNMESKQAIRDKADQYYQMLANEPIDFPDGNKRSIGMSMGIAWYRPGVENFDDFLKCADDALYEAKETGRNKYGEKAM